MSEPEYIERVVQALKKVKEKQLLLIELANSIPIKHGTLDLDVMSKKQQEINLAIAEAKAYGAGTLMAVDALVRIMSDKEL